MCEYTLVSGTQLFRVSLVCCAAALCAISAGAWPDDLFNRVEHHFAENEGVKIHYVSIGKGPLVVMVHGFPDWWYTWANQMDALSSDFRCVALDLRGYNQSDKPKGVENYAVPKLIADVLAVIKAEGADKVVLVGHDWGGGIAWQIALSKPELVDKLIIVDLPHPRGLRREMLINDEHRERTQYARDFQKPGAATLWPPEKLLARLVGRTRPESWTEDKKARYLAAYQASDIEAMLNIYKANYSPTVPPKAELPYHDDSPVVKTQMPVLMFHGLADPSLHRAALNDTWEWMSKDLTIVTFPGVDHWPHHDEAALVSSTMKNWLLSRQ
ncbi:MAG: alpha/beta hydrolase [Candidatus Hydrogenedentota bacterium]